MPEYDITIVLLNPFGSDTFGTHVFSGGISTPEPSHQCRGEFIFQHTDRTQLICNQCGEVISPDLSQNRTEHSCQTAWAMMTLQVAITPNCTTPEFHRKELWRLMPNEGSVEKVFSWDCWVWKSCLGPQKHLAAIAPPILSWPPSNENIALAGLHLVKAIAAIHSRSIQTAAESAQSALGWLWPK